jgi:hypothetical protein
MTLVSSHYAHLLVRRELADGRPGWFAPYEMDEYDAENARLAIPVDAQGRVYPEGYWVEIATLDEGWKLLDEPFLLEPAGDGKFQLVTPPALVEFIEAVPPDGVRVCPYAGELEHDDFRGPGLVELAPVRNEIFDLLCDRNKVVLLGCFPFNHYTKGGRPLEPKH